MVPFREESLCLLLSGKRELPLLPCRKKGAGPAGGGRKKRISMNIGLPVRFWKRGLHLAPRGGGNESKSAREEGKKNLLVNTKKGGRTTSTFIRGGEKWDLPKGKVI